MNRFGLMGVALLVVTAACEKRKPSLLPAKDAAKNSELHAPAAASKAQELRAKSFPEDPPHLAQDGDEPSLDEAADHPESTHLQRAKKEALKRLEGEVSNPHAAAATHAKNAAAAQALYQEARNAIGKGDFDTALDRYLSACQLGHGESCHKFGWHEERQGNAKNAQRFYEAACTRGINKGCNNHGLYLERQKSYDDAMEYYAKACMDQHKTSCENLKRLRDDRLRFR